MAEIKFTQLPAGAPITGPEIFAMVQSGVSVQTTANALSEFISDAGFNYGDGITFDDGTNTISADINTTNLQFTATQINTIQDIDLTASPTFETMTLTSTTAGFLMPRMTEAEFDSIPLPDNGLIAWANTSNRFRVNRGSAGTPNYANLAYFTDIPQDSTSFGEFYFQGNAVETVISTIGSPVKIDAVYNTGDLLNFTQGSGILTYTGDDTKEFSLNLSLTTTLNLNTANISVIIFINGSPLTKSIMSTFTGSTTPFLQNGSLNALVELSTNDTVELFIQNDTSTANIIVQDLNFNVATVGGAIGNLADQVVVAWDGSTSPVSVTAGTDIDISAGVISYTGSGGSGITGNFLLGSCTQPTQSYTFGVYSSMIQAFDGTQTVLANTLAIGEIIELSFTFNLLPTMPTEPSVAGTFRFTFGTIVIESQNVILLNSSKRTGDVKFTVTRVDATNVNVDVSGYFNTSNPITMQDLFPSPDLVGPNVLPYNAGLDSLVDVEWKPSVGNASNLLECVAQNLKINQYTDRNLAGPTQVVTSWDGSTAPVAVTSSGLIDISSGVISTAAEANVVTSWDGSSSPIAVTAGAGISITSGVISSTGGGAGNNTTFFTTLIPTDNYLSGVWTPMWATFDGNLTIAPFSFLEGETIVIDITGNVSVNIPGPNVDSGSLMRLTFGAAFTQVTNTLPILNAGTRVRPWSMKIKITRVSAAPSLLLATGVGYYYDANFVNRVAYFTFPLSLIPYDDSLAHTINLEFKNNNSPGMIYDFIATNLHMVKYS